MIMENFSARDELERIMKKTHMLAVLASMGSSHCSFNDYFINYSEVFSSKIDTHAIYCSLECIGSNLQFGVICPLNRE